MHQLFNLIYQWSDAHLDIIFFFYGLAFFVMGISILIVPKKESEFKLANTLWILAWFGLVHGTNEWLEMWMIVGYKSEILSLIQVICLITSFVLLYEFGRNLLKESFLEESTKLQKKLAKFLVWWISPSIVVFILFISFFTFHDFKIAGNILSRYFLCFPGALLVSFGLFTYYHFDERLLKELKVKRYFILLGLSIFTYGIFGGLIVRKWDYFPSNLINYESFFSITHIPVQIFRALIAIIIALTVNGIITIFNWEQRKKIKEALITDELTGIYNRRGFITVAEQQLKIAKRTNKGFLVIFADLDDLKIINDNFTHKEGDRALIDTANVMKSTFRESDIIGRIGGDEFVILALDTDESKAKIIETTFLNNIDAHNAKVKRRYNISLSIGIVYFDPSVLSSIEELLSKADRLMYENKKQKYKDKVQ
jgi:diguanylate cyclase (GGDEF)-like protein